VAKVLVIMLNTYREAVRARILHGLFALAVFSALYALVVGEYTTRNGLRVVSDVGSFAVSTYGIVVAIVMGATGLYRELELKTVFPILARPLWRGQYLVGKFCGTLLTLLVFMMANSAVLLFCLHFMAGGGVVWPLGTLFVGVLLAMTCGRFAGELRTYVPILWAAAMLVAGWLMAAEAPDDRRVIVAAATLAMFEVSIVAALATLFSAFTSPFLTAVFTFGVFVVGRSADTLAELPPRVFGQFIHDAGEVLSKVFPNLMVYVPPRPLLTGEAGGVVFSEYLALAGAQAALWTVGVLLVAGLVFRNRDFV
jgi:hypothetical protein